MAWPTPSNRFSRAIYVLANTLAESSHFRTLVSAADNAAARLAIHIGEARDEVVEVGTAPNLTYEPADPRPRVIVLFGERCSSQREGFSCWGETFNFLLFFETLWDRDTYATLAEGQLDALNTVGDIVEDLMTLSGTESGTTLTGYTHSNLIGFRLAEPVYQRNSDPQQSLGYVDYFETMVEAEVIG